MTEEKIDDSLKGIDFCNTHIRKLEMMIQQARDAGELGEAMRGEGHLVKWTELLEHFIHQAFQQGKTTTDVAGGLVMKKGRHNA